MKTLWYFLLSVLLHGLMYRFALIPSATSTEKAPKEIWQEITTEFTTLSPKNPNSKIASLSASSLSLGNQGIRLGAYQIDPDHLINPSHKDDQPKITELGLGTNLQDGTGRSWANSKESLQHLKISSELQPFIDSSLYYPRELSENNIQGTVEAALYFDSTGLFIRQKSQFKSSSNYLRVWLTRHLIRLFKTRLPFSIGNRPLKVATHFEFQLSAPLQYGSFQTKTENQDQRHSFRTYQSASSSKLKISGGKLFFFRSTSKRYGLFLASDQGMPMPTIDVFGLIDRIERKLDISKDQDRERLALRFLRDDPEW